MKPDKIDAIFSLKPGAKFALKGSAQSVKWKDSSQTEPTTEEINAELARLTTEYNNKQYQRDREYPSIGEQLDEIYHNGIDSWKAKIKAIKDKHPKP